MNIQRIGMYGGSFDPVHLGHLLVAQAAAEEMKLDRVCFIPAAQSPFKPATAPQAPTTRLALLRLALAGHSRFVLDDWELQRGGVSYSIDTVRHYARKFPAARLYYLIGADHIRQLPLWREADELARRVDFIVLPRPGQVWEPLPPPFQGQPLRGFPLSLSSSDIRERIRSGRSIDFLVPAAVAERIRNKGLYL